MKLVHDRRFRPTSILRRPNARILFEPCSSDKVCDEFTKAENASVDGFWQCQIFDIGLPRIQASDIGVSSTGTADFVIAARRWRFE
jgi:hypothetical protein